MTTKTLFAFALISAALAIHSTARADDDASFAPAAPTTPTEDVKKTDNDIGKAVEKPAQAVGKETATIAKSADKDAGAAGRDVGKETVTAARTVDKDADKAGKEVAKGTEGAAKDVAKGTETAAKDVAKDTGHAAKDVAKDAKAAPAVISHAASSVAHKIGGLFHHRKSAMLDKTDSNDALALNDNPAEEGDASGKSVLGASDDSAPAQAGESASVNQAI